MEQQLSFFKEEKPKFKDVRFQTAEEKEKAYRTFQRIIDGRNINLLDKNLYEHLHLHCGFIAHYDINGFKVEYSGTDGFKRFIDNFVLYGQREMMYSEDYNDINGELIKYAKKHYQKIMEEINYINTQAEIKIMKAIAEKYGYKIIPA